MFGAEKGSTISTPKRVGGSRDTGITILTAGCHFNGKLYCKGSTRIGGTVEGQIKADGLLVIEEESVINGDVCADEIIVHGTVVGVVEAKTRIELSQSARVTADITSRALVIHDGAQFNGKSMMRSTGEEPRVDQSPKILKAH